MESNKGFFRCSNSPLKGCLEVGSVLFFGDGHFARAMLKFRCVFLIQQLRFSTQTTTTLEFEQPLLEYFPRI